MPRCITTEFTNHRRGSRFDIRLLRKMGHILFIRREYIFKFCHMKSKHGVGFVIQISPSLSSLRSILQRDGQVLRPVKAV